MRDRGRSDEVFDDLDQLVHAGLGIWRYRLPCGFAWGHGGQLSYQVDVHVARDGSKAVVWAANKAGASDWSFGDRLYCA